MQNKSRTERSTKQNYNEEVSLDCPLPHSAQLASRLHVTSLQIVSIARCLPDLIFGRHKVRTPAYSAAEYEARWADQLRRRPWEGYENISDSQASRKGSHRRLTVLMEGKHCEVDIADFYRWRTSKIARIFQAFYNFNQPIVELGCGYGKNLFALWNGGFRNLAGYDVSQNGIEAIKEEAKYFGIDLKVDFLDLTNPLDPRWPSLNGKVVFTHYVMEQLPDHLNTVIESLLEARPIEIIHIEPMAELLHPSYSLTDLETWVHTYLSDYQTSLLRLLRFYEANQRLKIKNIIPLRFSPQIRSSPTLIRWSPI